MLSGGLEIQVGEIVPNPLKLLLQVPGGESDQCEYILNGCNVAYHHIYPSWKYVSCNKH